MTCPKDGLPSSNDYGSPMKIFEYMAMGKPVVVPDCPPLMEVIEDGRQGVIFQKNNVVSLANSLREVLINKTIYEKMSYYSRETIIKINNWENNSTKILKIMEKGK